MSAVTWIDELAELIADKCDDDGGLIMEAFSKALVLVGFDHDAEIIDQMITAYEGGMMPRFTLTWKPADEDARFSPADVGDYGLFSGIDDDDDDDDGGGGDDYTFPDDHPLFGLDDPARLPEDDPRYIPF